LTSFSAYQRFPATAPSAGNPNPAASPKDRNFALTAIVQGDLTATPSQEEPGISLRPAAPQVLRIDLTLFTPRDHSDNVAHCLAEARRLARLATSDLLRDSSRFWRDFWSHSAVELDDKELERLWYHNQYWLACCLREGKVAPGLFGN
jgi:alpha-L-fucosidase 2